MKKIYISYSLVLKLMALVLISLISIKGVHAAIIEIGPNDNIKATVDAMQPGDILELRSGNYILTSRFGITLNCTAVLPCEIRAKSGHTPHIQRLSADQNIIDIESSNYVTFRGIEFSGGSRGLRLNDSSFISLIDNYIHDTGDAAITANDTNSMYQDLNILRNHIRDTNGAGEGLYLGCNNNACQVFNSLIEGNYIHHTNGASVTQGDGIEIKEGSWGNIVRDNVIHDTGDPCIITYSTVGNGSANIIERNIMWGCGDHAIQSAADTTIRNNIILGSAADGIRSQPHQNGTPNNLEFSHNIILNTTGSVIRLIDVTGTVSIANNALYSQSGVAIRASGILTAVTVLNNIGQGSLIGINNGFNSNGDLAVDFVNASYSGSLPQDVFPKTGSLLINSANAQWNANDDFNLNSRTGSLDVGAYRFQPDGNPGWVLIEGFKLTDTIFINSFE